MLDEGKGAIHAFMNATSKRASEGRAYRCRETPRLRQSEAMLQLEHRGETGRQMP